MTIMAQMVRQFLTTFALIVTDRYSSEIDARNVIERYDSQMKLKAFIKAVQNQRQKNGTQGKRASSCQHARYSKAMGYRSPRIIWERY